MGFWKEDEEKNLYFSLFLPKYVCSVGILEFFPEGNLNIFSGDHE